MTYSSCREFYLDEHGSLYQLCGFPDPRSIYLGKIDRVDPEDAPPRIRPAIVELLDVWRNQESRWEHEAGLAADYHAALGVI